MEQAEMTPPSSPLIGGFGETKLSNGLRRRINEQKHKKGQPGTRM